MLHRFFSSAGRRSLSNGIHGSLPRHAHGSWRARVQSGGKSLTRRATVSHPSPLRSFSSSSSSWSQGNGDKNDNVVTALAWGKGDDFQLGAPESALTNNTVDQGMTAPRPIPIYLRDLRDATTSDTKDQEKEKKSGNDGDANVTMRSMSGGVTHSAAATSDGKMWTWGAAKLGVLGHGDDDDKRRPLPAVVEALAGERIAKVACGKTFTLALTEDGRVFTWGWGGNPVTFSAGCLGEEECW